MTSTPPPDSSPDDPIVLSPKTPSTPIDLTLGAQTVVAVPEAIADEKSTWLDSILSSRSPLPDSHPFVPLRRAADKEAATLSFPGRKQESWRFTDLKSIYASRYAPLPEPAHIQFDIRRCAPDTAGIVLVFVDGVYSDDLSITNDSSAQELFNAGGYIGSISGYQGDVGRVRQILSDAEVGSEVGGLFPTIGNAIASDAAVIHIPSNFNVSRPTAVVFVSSGGSTEHRAHATAPRLAVIAEQCSRISLLESHTSQDEDTQSLSLASSGFHLEGGASVTHYVMHDAGDESHVIQNVHAHVLRDALYDVRAFGLGSKVGRFTIGIDLMGEGSHGAVNGTLIACGYQVLDLHSRISHDALKTTSQQLQKNIASGHGRSIFNGRIVVTKNGDGTESEQLCRSLLLSDRAAVDAMPVLEISTDDVKATHGATVADLQEDELFYCQSRGLTLKDAQYLLVSGFAKEVIGDCPFPTVAEQVSRKVDTIAEISRERPRNMQDLSSI